jgi:hypothetical protein
LNEETIQCQGTVARWDMVDVRVTSAAESPYGSHAFQHNFQLLVEQKCSQSRKFLVLLVYPDRHSPLITVMPLSDWSMLKAPKYLVVPTAKSPGGLGSGDRAGHLTELLYTIKPKSGSGAAWQSGQNVVVPYHAWTACVAVDEEALVPRVPV